MVFDRIEWNLWIIVSRIKKSLIKFPIINFNRIIEFDKRYDKLFAKY